MADPKEAPGQAPEQPPKTFNRAAAKRAREMREAGEDFVLANTGDGDMVAKVKRPSLIDQAITSVMPKSSQNEVAAFFADVTQARQAGKGAAGIMETSLRRQKLADDLVIACFIKPRVFKSEAALDEFLEAHGDDPDAVTIEDIDKMDRLGFLIAAIETMGGVADARLARFRDRPLRDVPIEPNEQAPADAERDPESEE